MGEKDEGAEAQKWINKMGEERRNMKKERNGFCCEEMSAKFETH